MRKKAVIARSPIHVLLLVVIAAAGCSAKESTPVSAARQSAPVVAAQMYTPSFDQETGEALYRAACQGCHMADGAGASGAGKYPALKQNPALIAAGYPVVMIIYGRKAMPPMGGYMSDAQVAAVVNYIRSHFGNAYSDTVSAAQVAALRPKGGSDKQGRRPSTAP